MIVTRRIGSRAVAAFASSSGFTISGMNRRNPNRHHGFQSIIRVKREDSMPVVIDPEPMDPDRPILQKKARFLRPKGRPCNVNLVGIDEENPQ